jgi:hypothetical protein
MILYEGNWREDERAIAQQAIAAASIRLAEISGLAPDEAFACVFGDIILDAQPVVSGAYYGYVSALEPRRIQLEIGQITDKLVLHELGHVLILTDPSDTNPAEWLSRNVIRTASGRPVTGPVRNMGYYSEERTGYISIMYPDHQHPVYFDDGKTTTEDICDMFMSWITGNIANNEAGAALDKFVSEYIARRLAPCRKVE